MARRRLEDAKEGLKSCSLVGSNHRPQDNSIFYETYALPTELKELDSGRATKSFEVYVGTYKT